MDWITSESPFWPYYSTALFHTRKVITASVFVDLIIEETFAFLLHIADISVNKEKQK